MSTEITVKIGTFERSYILVETNAPQRYDGFGTLQVYEAGGPKMPRDRSDADQSRFVLVDVKHLEWQLGRYGSGLYVYHEVSEDLAAWVQEHLYKKLAAAVSVEQQVAIAERLFDALVAAAKSGDRKATDREIEALDEFKLAWKEVSNG